MTQYVTPNSLANYIRMMRQQFKGSFLIVEGGKDARVYKNFSDETKCQIITACGKENAVKALFILEADKFPGVLAIIDSDFGILESNSSLSQNLFVTDTHDLETMILQSPALEKVLREYGSERKIKELTKNDTNIRDLLLQCGIEVGYLRWYSHRSNLGLKFNGLNFASFVDKATLSVDKQKLVRSVKNNSQRPNLDEDNIHVQLNHFRNSKHDAWHICCGHDLVHILALGLCKVLGSCKPNTVTPEEVERYLRLAYEKSFFQDTSLFVAIRLWEDVNSPYQVLSN